MPKPNPPDKYTKAISDLQTSVRKLGKENKALSKSIGKMNKEIRDLKTEITNIHVQLAKLSKSVVGLEPIYFQTMVVNSIASLVKNGMLVVLDQKAVTEFRPSNPVVDIVEIQDVLKRGGEPWGQP